MYPGPIIPKPWLKADSNDSQGYIAELAARALIFIESDNSKIGLMFFVAIGTAEVSSCKIKVKPGQHIKKGDTLCPSMVALSHIQGQEACTCVLSGTIPVRFLI